MVSKTDTENRNQRAHLYDAWQKRLDTCSYAMQPIISTATGTVIGYELLLETFTDSEMVTYEHFFNTAARQGVLLAVTEYLLRRGIKLFREVVESETIQLFFNIDARLLENPLFSTTVRRIISQAGLHSTQLTLEISEHCRIHYSPTVDEQISSLKWVGIRIALDDFGTGYSGLETLYRIQPQVIKISRFFITNIEDDPSRRSFLTALLGLSHHLGCRVIANGVESMEEFLSCSKSGVNTMQGALFGSPESDATLLRSKGVAMALFQRRSVQLGGSVLSLVEHIPPFVESSTVLHLFETFLTNHDRGLIPIITEEGTPLGAVLESSMKQYAYSRYGRELLLHFSREKTLHALISPLPVVESSIPLPMALEIYNLCDDHIPGLIVTQSGIYHGFIPSKKLLSLSLTSNRCGETCQMPELSGEESILFNPYRLPDLK